ncbi:MAG: sigma-70 family RNA polymerase sigma factor [Planctomycetota bacterium]
MESRSLPDPRLDATLAADVAQHGAFLRALARRLCGDASAADDLVQETWIDAWRAGRPASRGWLATVLRRKASNATRTSTRRRVRESRSAPSEAVGDAAAPLEEIEFAEQLLGAVRALPEPYRSTVFLRYYEGLAPAAIAERTETELSTVKTRLARAIERLRARLDEGSSGRQSAWMASAASLAEIERTTVAAKTGVAFAPIAAVGAVAAVGALAWWLVGESNADGVASASGESIVRVESDVEDSSLPSAVAGLSAQEAADERTPLVATSRIGIVENLTAEGPVPAANVTVIVETKEASGPDLRTVDGLGTARPRRAAGTFEVQTDEHGRFDVGEAEVLTVKHDETYRHARWRSDGEGTNADEIRLVRIPHGTLRGVVTDLSGSPVEGAAVTATTWNGEVAREARTDADGAFSFEHHRHGPALDVTLDGWTLAGTQKLVPLDSGGWEPTEFVLARSGRLIVEFESDPGSEMVRGAMAIPLPCEVPLDEADFIRSMREVIAETNEPVQLTALPVGQKLLVVVGPSHTAFASIADGVLVPTYGHVPDADPIVIPESGSLVVRAPRERSELIEARVVDGANEPVEGADVVLTGPARENMGLGEYYGRGQTDAEGRVAIAVHGIGRTGTFFLRAARPRDGRTRQPRRYTSLALDMDRLSTRELTLQLDQPPLLGVVRLPKGDLARTKLRFHLIRPTVEGEGTPDFASGLDDLAHDGTFELHGRPPGLYRVTATHPEFAPTCADLELGRSAAAVIRLDEPRRATVAVRVVAEPGVDIAGLTYASVFAPEGAVSSAPLLDEGPHRRSRGSQPDRGRSPLDHDLVDAGWAEVVESRMVEEAGGELTLSMRPGLGWISASGKVDRGPIVPVSTGLVVIPEGESSITLIVAATAAVEGRVRTDSDAELGFLCLEFVDASGEPLPVGPKLTGHPLTMVPTSALGRFRVDVPTGAYRVRIGTRDELERGAPRRTADLTVPCDEPLVL